jgi:hypothetical protein
MGAGKLATMGLTKLEGAAIPVLSKGASFLSQHGAHLAAIGKEALDGGAFAAVKKAIEGPEAETAAAATVRAGGRELKADLKDTLRGGVDRAKELRATIGEKGVRATIADAPNVKVLKDVGGHPIKSGKAAIGELKTFKNDLNALRKDVVKAWKENDGKLPDKVKAEVATIVKHVEKLADSKVVKAGEKGVAAYEAINDPLGALKDKVKEFQLASGKSLEDRLEALEGALDDTAANLAPGAHLVANEVVEDDERTTVGG